jgi:hypothetical protein
MSEAKGKWDAVGDRFSDLGRHVKERYDASSAFTEEQNARLNDAISQIVEALDAGFTAVGDSLRDPAIRDELKQAGNAIGDAISSTFTEVATEIKRAVGKKT